MSDDMKITPDYWQTCLDALAKELSDGKFVWTVDRDFIVNWEAGVGTCTEEPLPEFPAQALDAPRDFDGGALARFIDEA